jgi:hypothetical protein
MQAIVANKTRALGTLLVLLVKVSCMAVVYAMPLLGMWAASSLATYLNGPRWVPFAVGGLAFPVVPLAWEAFGAWRRRRRDQPKPRILTFGDRLTLRTFVLNLLFLAVVVGAYPSQLFTSLSTRGDWFLEKHEGPAVDRIRMVAFAGAAQLEWLYELTHKNPFAEKKPSDDEERGEDDDVRPVANKDRRRGDNESRQRDAEDSQRFPGKSGVAGGRATSKGRSKVSTKEPIPRKEVAKRPVRWPLPQQVHAAVKTMPRSATASPEAVGDYLRAQEADPFLLTKAVHDFVANHVSYDVPASLSPRPPPQDARTAFETGKAVCAGYAKLAVAVGEAAGLEIRYVVGDSRSRGGSVDGRGHAWNVVRLDGRWYLMDVTWDAGYVTGNAFTKRYCTDYLLTPPLIFGLDHFPEEARWQLRHSPISRGEFMRQPVLRPNFFAMGLELRSPKRSQVSVEDHFDALLGNPRNQSVLATLEARNGGRQWRCKVEGGKQTSVQCPMPAAGTYRVLLFANEARSGTHDFVGQFEVNAG